MLVTTYFALNYNYNDCKKGRYSIMVGGTMRHLISLISNVPMRR